jgi:hypothetical protein
MIRIPLSSLPSPTQAELAITLLVWQHVCDVKQRVDEQNRPAPVASRIDNGRRDAVFASSSAAAASSAVAAAADGSAAGGLLPTPPTLVSQPSQVLYSSINRLAQSQAPLSFMSC